MAKPGGSLKIENIVPDELRMMYWPIDQCDDQHDDDGAYAD